jgi:hypothetical protein
MQINTDKKIAESPDNFYAEFVAAGEGSGFESKGRFNRHRLIRCRFSGLTQDAVTESHLNK